MNFLKPIGIIAIVIASIIGITSAANYSSQMPFGGQKDVDFAHEMWDAMDGYTDWPMKSGFIEGNSPHGQIVRLYYNIVNVDEKPYHVVIKDNYGGEGMTFAKVAKNPDDYLAAVTIMVQREDGYDPENNDWYWAKYLADGSLDKNARGAKLAGRVAKGMNAGCIDCHKDAGEDDYLFSND
ncbi:MAG: cytochrome P460 family protein [Candidatus Kapaibacterium sp.]